MTKHEVARVLQDIAFFLFQKGDNPFKAQAYERAATAVLTAPADLADLIATNSLIDLSGIGPTTARVITELVTTGNSTVHEEAKGEFPLSLVTLGEVPVSPASRSSSSTRWPVSPQWLTSRRPAGKDDSWQSPASAPSCRRNCWTLSANMNAGRGITYTPTW